MESSKKPEVKIIIPRDFSLKTLITITSEVEELVLKVVRSKNSLEVSEVLRREQFQVFLLVQFILKTAGLSVNFENSEKAFIERRRYSFCNNKNHCDFDKLCYYAGCRVSRDGRMVSGKWMEYEGPAFEPKRKQPFCNIHNNLPDICRIYGCINEKVHSREEGSSGGGGGFGYFSGGPG